MLDDDFTVDATLAEGGAIWSPPRPTPAGASHDCRALYERERARAEAAQARCEELRWAEVAARTEAGSWKARFKSCRHKHDAAVEETKKLRREVKAGAPGLHREVTRLRKELSQALAEPSAAATQARKHRLAALEAENLQLRKTVKAAKAAREAAHARLASLRAARKTLSKKLSGMDAELRRALRRSRRQKSAIKSLAGENARLRKAVKGARRRIEALQAQLARLRSTGAVLSRKLFGRKSEQQDKPRSQRQRGQQRGAPGHGRTQRPGLEERAEVHKPPPEACICACCGQPYAPNGVEQSTLVEIEVKAHKRVIRRPRLRRTCQCASSPVEVSAPPVPRLFDDTLYGITVWVCFLYERYACYRPLNAVAAWLSERGLALSPGTLADSVKRFLALFEPLAEAILAHQNMATVRHADETSWRVQEFRGEERSSRAWLWTSVSSDAVYFHIDPSRSAEAAYKLFAGTVLDTVIVCDRYSAYKKLARLLAGLVILAWCWRYVAARIMLRRAGTGVPGMKILHLTAT